MPKKSGKLSDEQQYQICQWYAQFKTPTQIQRLIKSEWGIEMANKNVWQYAHGNAQKRWKPMIERLRQEWVLGVMDIPLAHKRARMEKLVNLLGRAERLDLDTASYAQKYAAGAKAVTTERDKIKLQMEILREMREEMEAGKTEFSNTYLTTIHVYSDAEIAKRMQEVALRLKQLRKGDRDAEGNVWEIAAQDGDGQEAEIVAKGTDRDALDAADADSGGGSAPGRDVPVGQEAARADAEGSGELIDARGDGAQVESPGQEAGVLGEAGGCVRVRDDAEDRLETQAGTGQSSDGPV